MVRYLKCACGNIVRVVGEIKKGKCPRCEIGLCWAEGVTKEVWLGGHGLGGHDLEIFKDHQGKPYRNILKSSRRTTLT